jgi:hypothetical protein
MVEIFLLIYPIPRFITAPLNYGGLLRWPAAVFGSLMIFSDRTCRRFTDLWFRKELEI